MHSSHSAIALAVNAGEPDQYGFRDCASLQRLCCLAKVLAMSGAPLVSVWTYLKVSGREGTGGVKRSGTEVKPAIWHNIACKV